MEKFGFQKVSNNPSQPGQPSITHNIRIPHPQTPPAQMQPLRESFRKQLMVDNAPGNDVVVANCVAVNPADFAQVPDRAPVILDGNFVYSIAKDERTKPGTIGLAGNMRTWGKWSLGQPVTIENYNIFQNGQQQQYLGAVDLFIDFKSRSRANSNPINHDQLVDLFLKKYENQILQPTQVIYMEFNGAYFSVLVNSVQVIDVNTKDHLPSFKDSDDLSTKGILLKSTDVLFYPAEGSVINLTKNKSLKSRIFGGSSNVHHRPHARKQIINPDFKLEDLGIGGLDAEFQDIFRRAFNSRILPPDIAEKLDYKHCKGLLLYGPPGTGKTLIARKLSKMLNGKEPKIVNGPEMLSKYVGASEENIRNLFKDAEAEYKQKGEDSDLHVIIFDELDSVFKQRGSARSDGTGVGDNVVNQLLSKMDGVDQLNNILVIGMTNRLDLIDTALLRPGRFEIQIEIALPDEKGRKDIFLIHTKKLRENDILTPDVNFDELSILTKNFTGAEIEGLCNSAKSYAISRHTKKGSLAQIDPETIANLKITRNDFLLALNDIRPAFGTDEEDLSQQAKHGIIQFNEAIRHVFEKGQSIVDVVRSSETETLRSILLYGAAGVGKTAIATTLALNSDFPFIKMLSAETLVGMGEARKIQEIDTVFRDVHKSPLNVLVIDKIENIINYNPIGPRFSNDILQVLMVYLTKKPPKGRRLLIIGTTSQYSVFKHMNLVDAFTDTIPIPPIKKVEEIGRVLEKLGFMTERDREEILHQLSQYEINIGVKGLIDVLMVSKYSKDNVDEVVANIVEKMNAL
ncbi:vesicular-fusion protein SEC18 [Spathaspora passalidarum NRRL Y-27907]|uniref:Vesicular-fusion protein SEC18 n=1 Tax=Spathaspora passalidarum (strain NRRL Y-27907 / 11-Y1) TaxID=619300 RepID=G3ANM8_SPAPN|nr:vesicular-fusion protein SEC18 [Spathaspora passalidarum NRRL Y-27907]EGW32557.1 vesicular-fusion protein SEC18 [Spathaspora passalidarum NRRL Y-27907]